jgi:hypothetical protein
MGCTSSKKQLGTSLSKTTTGDINFNDEIKHFVFLIADDVGQNVLAKQRDLYKCGDFLNNPLPIDTASTPNRAEVLLQLLHTVGDNPLKQAYLLQSVECQSANVLCSVAASGIGKTHMVYALGLSDVYAIVIRVGLQTGGLSQPWSTLKTNIEEVYRHSGDQSLNLDRVSICMSFIRLLILCYVDITIKVISIVLNSKQIEREYLPEIILRFHRNGKSERLIEQFFTEKIQLILNNNQSRKSCQQFIKSSRNEIDKQISSFTFPVRPFFICFDEIQVLMHECSNCFFSTTDYCNQRQKNETKSDCCIATNDDGTAASRDLFDATFYVMTEVLTQEKWTVFMTGTYFSLNLADSSPCGFSSARGGKIAKVFPTGIITVLDMQKILQFYWNIPDEIFENPIVVDLLSKFYGRPLLFADGVFKIMCNEIMQNRIVTTTTITADWLSDHLRKGYAEMKQHFQNMFQRLVLAQHVIPNESHYSTAALIPNLIDHFLFHNEFRLSEVKDQVIASGLLGFQETEDGTCVAREEPLVRDAIVSTTINLLKERYNDVVQVVANASRIKTNSKGDSIEYLVVLDLALRSRLEYANEKKSLTLGKYLAQFGIHYSTLDLWDISSNISPKKYSSRDNQTFFRAFSDSKSIDYAFYGIDQYCGVDMAFQVSHSTEKRKGLVIFSLKNEVKTSLMDLSLTLHPATQYLNNYPRKMLLHEISPWRVTCMTSSVPHLEDHFNFFVNETFEDTTSWIRVGLIAVSIDDKSAEISKNLCDNDDFFWDP